MRKDTSLHLACGTLGAIAAFVFALVAFRVTVALHRWRQLGWPEAGFQVDMAGNDMWALLTTCLALCGTAAMLFVWQRGHSRFVVRSTAAIGILSLITAVALRVLISVGTAQATGWSADCAGSDPSRAAIGCGG